ncbi:MAG: hypothetical protein HZB92_02590 [Euryarchaeota archaeon]|nr:hypothetical protein [Euryarchaeota archaeon]
MGTLSRGWKLAKVSFSVLGKDKELMLFPLISGIITIGIWISFFVGFFFVAGLQGMLSGLLGMPNDMWVYFEIAIGFLVYVVSYFIAIYFNAAVVGAAMIRLNGGDPTLSDGIKAANKHIGKIFMWALFSATVAMILRAISERAGFVGKIIVGFIGMAWNFATFFVVPVIVFEGLGPWGAVKRSMGILRRSWGEALVGQLSMGFIIFLLALVGLVPLFIGIYALVVTTNLWIFAILVLVAVIYWVFIGVLSSAAQGVLVAALYKYATTGETHPDFMPYIPPPVYYGAH